jgi:hypothetical protein
MVVFEQIIAECGRMISSPLIIQATEIMYVMSKQAPVPYFEPQTTDNLDLGLSGMPESLRKPLKLTATLKRRALKTKAGEKSTLAGARLATEASKGR